MILKLNDNELLLVLDFLELAIKHGDKFKMFIAVKLYNRIKEKLKRK